MNIKILRPAVAMIELIFAIVVIGLVLMSAPMLMQTAANSGYVTTQQEAISEVAARISMVMGYHWDENDTDEEFLDPILNVSSTGDNELDKNSTTKRRKGTPLQSYRSFIRSDSNESLNASTSFGPVDTGETSGTEDDIDDFDGNITYLTGSSASADYIDSIKIKTIVTYISDSANYNSSAITYNFNPSTATTATTNIKMIEANLTSTSNVPELNKTIILRAFSCNIGGYELEERSF